MNVSLKIGAAAVLSCAGWFAAQSNPVLAQSASATPPTDQIERGTGGMVVHVDPATGRFLPEAPAGSPKPASTPAEQNAASTSSVGLVEQPAPGGGMMLDLQGRFQSPLIATIGPDGKLTTQHVHEPAHDRPRTSN